MFLFIHHCCFRYSEFVNYAAAAVLIIIDHCFPEILNRLTAAQIVAVYIDPAGTPPLCTRSLSLDAPPETSSAAETRTLGSALLPTLRTKHPQIPHLRLSKRQTFRVALDCLSAFCRQLSYNNSMNYQYKCPLSACCYILPASSITAPAFQPLERQTTSRVGKHVHVSDVLRFFSNISKYLFPSTLYTQRMHLYPQMKVQARSGRFIHSDFASKLTNFQISKFRLSRFAYFEKLPNTFLLHLSSITYR